MCRRRLLWLTLLFVVCLQASANRGGFYYRNISIEAVVHANNVWEITETFDIFFEEPRHGFYRYIPNSFKLDHEVDGEMHEFRYESDIDDIDVDGWEFTTSDSDDEFCIIRIGDADEEVEGDQQYVISYTYSYPDDRLKTMDYLFHTVLGTEFEQRIEHVDFDITFDKELPDDIADLLEVYAGLYGKTTGMIPDLNVKVSATRITGEADDVAPRHGITLYAQLPEGYYEGARTVCHLWLYLFLGLTILCIVAIIWCQLRQTTPHITKVIEFYPPEGVSSAEVGTIIDGTVDDIDIASLIPWLAGQGYISIKETQKGKLIKTTDLELTKLKDLPSGTPDYQKRLMSLLFSGKDVVNMKSIGRQPARYQKIKDALSKHFKGERELTTLSGSFFFYPLLALLGTLTLGFNTVVSTLDWTTLLGAGLLFGAPCLAVPFIRMSNRVGDIMHSSAYHIFFIIVKAVLMVVTWLAFSALYIDYGAPLNQWSVLALYMVCFVLNELAGRFSVDTDYRVQMMGRLLGFKEFIKTAEKSRLAQLQTDDPQYFYKVLPYAMVFKLSDKWENLFGDIQVDKPDWYDSYTPLMGAALTHNMVHNFSSTVSDAISTISHDNSSSGGGGGFSGGGGGGFSGGGGGGGGGGSW